MDDNEYIDTFEYELLICKLPNNIGIHDRKHAERVLKLSSFLAIGENLTSEERRILYGAAVFHDVGRKNDAVDPNHGWGGYMEYIKEFGMNDVAEFLVVYHCKPDNVAKKHMENKKLSMDKERVWLLYQILKDSDALDRMRFGGLDTRYLRLEKSHEFIEVAKILIEMDK